MYSLLGGRLPVLYLVLGENIPNVAFTHAIMLCCLKDPCPFIDPNTIMTITYP